MKSLKNDQNRSKNKCEKNNNNLLQDKERNLK